MGWTRDGVVVRSHVLFVIREHPEDAPLFRIAGGECVEIETSSDPYFELGSEIALTDFAAFESRSLRTRTPPDPTALVPVDPSRVTVGLAQSVGVDGAVTRAVSTGYYDEKLGTPCEPATASDGVKRCLPPTNTTVGWVFADARCTAPLVSRQSTGSYTRWESGTGLAPRIRIFPVVAEYPRAAPLFHPRSDGKCIAEPTLHDLTYSMLGAEIPPTDFVAFTEPHAKSRSLRGRRKAR